MTDRPEPMDAQNVAEQRWLAWQGMVEERARVLAELPDEHLIGDAGAAGRTGRQRFEYGLEMQRRLRLATEKLTAGLVRFRESSEVAAGRSEASAAKLERLTRWLIGFTVALVVLTVAVAVLTAVLAAKG